jgi:hypothetical protein
MREISYELPLHIINEAYNAMRYDGILHDMRNIKIYPHAPCCGYENRIFYEKTNNDQFKYVEEKYYYNDSNLLYVILNNLLLDKKGMIIIAPANIKISSSLLKYIDIQSVNFKGFSNYKMTCIFGLSFLYEVGKLHSFLINNISVHLDTDNGSYVIDYQKLTGHLNVVYAPVAYLRHSNFQFPHVTEFRIKAKYVVLDGDFLDIFPNLKTFIIQTGGRGLCRDHVNTIATKYNVSIVVNK